MVHDEFLRLIKFAEMWLAKVQNRENVQPVEHQSVFSFHFPTDYPLDKFKVNLQVLQIIIGSEKLSLVYILNSITCKNYENHRKPSKSVAFSWEREVWKGMK